MTFLTIITVVYNDWPGLRSTLESAMPYGSDDIEHWVIDGSTTGEVRAGMNRSEWAHVRFLSERDQGMYDAMNKGLDRAAGDYVLFLNAGDTLDKTFNLEIVKNAADGTVLVGYCIRYWKSDAFLQPSVGDEHRSLSLPAHQATFYPRSFYSSSRYVLDVPCGADERYTASAAAEVSATFIPTIVCRFALGGRSTSYGDVKFLILRYREAPSRSTGVKLAIKALLWRVLPRVLFYRMLAYKKFTRLISGDEQALISRPLPLGTASRGIDQTRLIRRGFVG